MIAAPTSSPTLALPSDGATNQPVNLTLSWGTVVNAATYAVQVATDPTFATTLYSQHLNSAATTMALSSLSNSTTYYWRAGAKNAGGVSGWSTVSSFTTVIAAPTSSPALSLPTDGATNQPVNLTLSWGTVVNTATYAVQVAMTDVRDDAVLAVEQAPRRLWH